MTEREKPHIVCWDLDDTIGNFGGLIFHKTGNTEFMEPLKIRYGMRDLLRDFSEENGFVNFITSSSSMSHITEVTNRIYMNKKFKSKFSKDELKPTSEGKHYRSVAPGYTEDEKQEKMLVIGDNPGDKPLDVRDMVFIQIDRVQEEALDALVVREIVTTLLDKGDGNFSNGFAQLYEEATNENEVRTIRLGEDIEFTMQYQHSTELPDDPSNRIPVIKNIKSPINKKKVELFF